MINIKQGAMLTESVAMAAILAVADRAYGGYGEDAIITSGTDSKHGRGSLHYVGHALDFRTRNVSDEQATDIRDQMAEALGSSFDVLIESDHLHVEWQPK